MGLKETKAIGMDGSYETSIHLSQKCLAKARCDTLLDAMLKRLSGAIRKRERDHGRRGDTVGKKVGDALGDHLGLSRTRARDDLEVGSAVPHSPLGISDESWTIHMRSAHPRAPPRGTGNDFRRLGVVAVGRSWTPALLPCPQRDLGARPSIGASLMMIQGDTQTTTDVR